MIVVDVQNDFSDKETALDALRVGFEATVLSQAVKAANPDAGDGDVALDQIEGAGGRVE